MFSKKTNLISFFILPLLVTNIAKTSNNPERKRYVIVVNNNDMNEFRAFSAIKRDNAYTQVRPHGNTNWWNGTDITLGEDNHILPLISSLDQLGVNDLNLQFNYNGIPRTMEFLSIPDRHYKTYGHKNLTGESYQCDNCERYLYTDENIFSYLGYRHDLYGGVFNSHEVCLNCLESEVEKKKWEVEKKETIKAWQDRSTNWPGCDAFNGIPNEILAILYDYTQPTPTIELKPEFKVIWPMDENTEKLKLQMQLSEKEQILKKVRKEKKQALNDLQDTYKKIQKTNRKSMLMGFVLGVSAIIIVGGLFLSPKKRRSKAAARIKHKKSRRKNSLL